VVVLDVMLPKMDGLTLLQKWRKAGVKSHVLMLTARDQLDDKVKGLDAGADDYLTKPFSYVVLLAKLRALVRRGAIARPTILTVGDLTFDPASRELRLAGEPVTLTHRELSLLEYFMRRPGHVVSKMDLLDHVWDAAEGTDPNLVEVYVGYVRRKIGREKLETVRGAGYRLVRGAPAS
jgi:DNA-binding response OmpR family regulator